MSNIFSQIAGLTDPKNSDAPTFGIAETTRTDHFSLSLRKLPNRNRPEPTLKSKLILHVLSKNSQKFSIMILIWSMHAFVHIDKWVSWILRIHFCQNAKTEGFRVQKSFTRTTVGLSSKFPALEKCCWKNGNFFRWILIISEWTRWISP